MRKFENILFANISATVCIVLLQMLLGSGCAASAGYAERCLDNTVASTCTGPRLVAQDLSGRDLTGRSLEGADLRFIVMNRATARSADFTGANLSRAKLMNTDLRQANLENADLSFADLRGADLRGAKLAGANFSGADVRGALMDSHARAGISGAVTTDRDRQTGSWNGSAIRQPEPAGVAL